MKMDRRSLAERKNPFELPEDVVLTDVWEEVVVDVEKSTELLQQGYNPCGLNVSEQIAKCRAKKELALRRIRSLREERDDVAECVFLSTDEEKDAAAELVVLDEKDALDIGKEKATAVERVALTEDFEEEVCESFRRAWIEGLVANAEAERKSEERAAAVKKAEREAITAAFDKAERRAAERAKKEAASAEVMKAAESKKNSKDDMLNWFSKEWIFIEARGQNEKEVLGEKISGVIKDEDKNAVAKRVASKEEFQEKVATKRVALDEEDAIDLVKKNGAGVVANEEESDSVVNDEEIEEKAAAEERVVLDEKDALDIEEEKAAASERALGVEREDGATDTKNIEERDTMAKRVVCVEEKDVVASSVFLNTDEEKDGAVNTKIAEEIEAVEEISKKDDAINLSEEIPEEMVKEAKSEDDDNFSFAMADILQNRLEKVLNKAKDKTAGIVAGKVKEEAAVAAKLKAEEKAAIEAIRKTKEEVEKEIRKLSEQIQAEINLKAKKLGQEGIEGMIVKMLSPKEHLNDEEKDAVVLNGEDDARVVIEERVATAECEILHEEDALDINVKKDALAVRREDVAMVTKNREDEDTLVAKIEEDTSVAENEDGVKVANEEEAAAAAAAKEKTEKKKMIAESQAVEKENKKLCSDKEKLIKDIDLFDKSLKEQNEKLAPENKEFVIKNEQLVKASSEKDVKENDNDDDQEMKGGEKKKEGLGKKLESGVLKGKIEGKGAAAERVVLNKESVIDINDKKETLDLMKKNEVVVVSKKECTVVISTVKDAIKARIEKADEETAAKKHCPKPLWKLAEEVAEEAANEVAADKKDVKRKVEEETAEIFARKVEKRAAVAAKLKAEGFEGRSTVEHEKTEDFEKRSAVEHKQSKSRENQIDEDSNKDMARNEKGGVVVNDKKEAIAGKSEESAKAVAVDSKEDTVAERVVNNEEGIVVAKNEDGSGDITDVEKGIAFVKIENGAIVKEENTVVVIMIESGDIAVSSEGEIIVVGDKNDAVGINNKEKDTTAEFLVLGEEKDTAIEHVALKEEHGVAVSNKKGDAEISSEKSDKKAANVIVDNMVIIEESGKKAMKIVKEKVVEKVVKKVAANVKESIKKLSLVKKHVGTKINREALEEGFEKLGMKTIKDAVIAVINKDHAEIKEDNEQKVVSNGNCAGVVRIDEGDEERFKEIVKKDSEEILARGMIEATKKNLERKDTVDKQEALNDDDGAGVVIVEKNAAVEHVFHNNDKEKDAGVERVFLNNDKKKEASVERVFLNTDEKKEAEVLMDEDDSVIINFSDETDAVVVKIESSTVNEKMSAEIVGSEEGSRVANDKEKGAVTAKGESSKEAAKVEEESFVQKDNLVLKKNLVVTTCIDAGQDVLGMLEKVGIGVVVQAEESESIQVKEGTAVAANENNERAKIDSDRNENDNGEIVGKDDELEIGPTKDDDLDEPAKTGNDPLVEVNKSESKVEEKLENEREITNRDGIQTNNDMNNDSSNQVKDDIEVPIVFEEASVVIEKDFHDSASNDDDGLDERNDFEDVKNDEEGVGADAHFGDNVDMSACGEQIFHQQDELNVCLEEWKDMDMARGSRSNVFKEESLKHREGIGVMDIAKRVRQSCAESLKQKESLELIESPVQMESLKLREGLMRKESLEMAVGIVETDDMFKVLEMSGEAAIVEEGLGVLGMTENCSQLTQVKEFRSDKRFVYVRVCLYVVFRVKEFRQRFEYCCMYMYIVVGVQGVLVMTPHVRAVALVNIDELEMAGAAAFCEGQQKTSSAVLLSDLAPSDLWEVGSVVESSACGDEQVETIFDI